MGPFRSHALAGLVVCAVLSAAPRAQSSSGTRVVYVSALAGKGVPVRDLTAGDFVLKEDGQLRDVLTAEIAKTPMQVVLMLDDGGLGLGAIRQGAGDFIQALQGRAEFAIMTLGAQNLPLVPFTAEPTTLYSALLRMFARNNAPVYVLDGLLEVAQAFQKREAVRPVIVTIATEGEELSEARAEAVLDAIQKSRARVYYIGIGAPVTRGYRPPYAADRPNDSREDESGKRNVVIGSAPQNSGGRSEQALQTSGIPVLMKQFAEELSAQYAVTYRTDAARAKLSVETKRKGVKLRAPARVGSR